MFTQLAIAYDAGEKAPRHNAAVACPVGDPAPHRLIGMGAVMR